MSPQPDPLTDTTKESSLEPSHPTPPHLSWFLRRELLSIPLALALVLTLLVFGISPATLLFVALMTVLVLGWVWSGHTT